MLLVMLVSKIKRFITLCLMIFVILLTCLLTMYWFCKEKLYVMFMIYPFSPQGPSHPLKQQTQTYLKTSTEENNLKPRQIKVRISTINNQNISCWWLEQIWLAVVRQNLSDRSINQAHLPNHSNLKYHKKAIRNRGKTIEPAPSARKHAAGAKRGKSAYTESRLASDWLKTQHVLIWLVKALGVSCFTLS